MVLTTFPPTTRNGYASGGVTDHRTPLSQRWASWYVTGRPGPNRHMGNKLLPSQADTSAPVVLDSVLVFGGLDGSAMGFDRRTGMLRWKRQLAGSEVYGAVQTAAGLAIVPQEELWGIDPRSGAVVWRFGGPDGVAGAHDVATCGDTVFSGSGRGWASAVDARTGRAFWSVDLAEAPFRPLVAGDVVIYGTRGFRGVDRDGPYASREEAERAPQIAQERAAAWNSEDDD